MSIPRDNYSDSLYGAMQEMTSAISALTMPAEPLPNAESAHFLVDADATAKHSHDHMIAAMQCLMTAIKEREEAKAS